jgi:hypothetical protein
MSPASTPAAPLPPARPSCRKTWPAGAAARILSPGHAPPRANKCIGPPASHAGYGLFPPARATWREPPNRTADRPAVRELQPRWRDRAGIKYPSSAARGGLRCGPAVVFSWAVCYKSSICCKCSTEGKLCQRKKPSPLFWRSSVRAATRPRPSQRPRPQRANRRRSRRFTRAI